MDNTLPKLHSLYNTVSKDYELGSYEDFVQKMNDVEKRQVFFQAVGNEYEIGNSFKEFNTKVMPEIAASTNPVFQANQQKPEIEVDEKEYPETAKDPGWKQLINSLASGSAQTGSMLARLPAGAYDIASIPINLVAKITGNEDLQVESPEWLKNNPVANYYDRQAELQKAKNSNYDKTIIELFREGNVSDAFQSLGNQVAENLPNYIALATATAAGSPTAALSVMGLGTVEQKKVQEEKSELNLNKSILEKQINAFNNGALEVITERLGTVNLINIGKGLIKKFGEKEAKTILKKSLSQSLKDFMGKWYAISGPVGEGVEEYANQVAQNLNDISMGFGKNKDPFAGATDAFLTGAFTAAGPSVGVGIASKISGKTDQAEKTAKQQPEEEKPKEAQKAKTMPSYELDGKPQTTAEIKKAIQDDEIISKIASGEAEIKIENDTELARELEKRINEASTNVQGEEGTEPASQDVSKESGLKGQPEAKNIQSEFDKIRQSEGNRTEKAVQYGLENKDQLPQLKELLKQGREEFAKIKEQIKNEPDVNKKQELLKKLSSESNNQFYREAIEAIEKTGSIGKAMAEGETFEKEKVTTKEGVQKELETKFKLPKDQAIATSSLLDAEAQAAVDRGQVKTKEEYYNELNIEYRRSDQATADQLKQKALFQQRITVEATKEQLDKITPAQWEKISKYMVQRNYDYRGGEDAKMLFTKHGEKTFSDEQASALREIAGFDATKQKSSGIITEKTDSQVYIEGAGWYHRRILEDMGYDFVKIKIDDKIKEFQKEDLPDRFNFTQKQVSDITRKAKKEFGLTESYDEAGYLTLDGKLLDFSGKREGGERGTRSRDHREINSEYTDFDEFRAMGNIRMKPESDGFEVWKNLTPEQKKTLRPFIKRSNEGILLDLVDPNNNRETSIEYNRNTNPEKIFKDIDDFFNNRDIQPQSKLSQFRGETLFQEQAKGAAEFASDGRAIIHAFNNADVSTGIHEIAHVRLKRINQRAATGDKWAKDYIDDLITEYNKQHKTTKKSIDTDIQEFYARGNEKYLREGVAPNSKLQALFNDFRNWLSNIYTGMHNQLSGIEISPQMKNLFDQIFDADIKRINKDYKVVDLTQKKTTRTYDEKTVKGWVQNQGGIKPADLAQHGISNKEDKKLFIDLARENGVSLDELAERAIEKGILYQSRQYNPSDALIQAIKDNAANRQSDPLFQEAPPVESEAFKKWFGDSKVVDSKRNPLIIYHGSPDARFMKEDATFKTKTEKYGAKRQENEAYFFTDDYKTAKTYADPHRAFDYQGAEDAVIPVYLSIKNPLVIEALGQSWNKFDYKGHKGTYEITKYAQQNKFDGIIIKHVKDRYTGNENIKGVSNVYVVFEPTQIKSATGNRGTFDANNPNILFQEKQPKSSIRVKGGKIQWYTPGELPKTGKSRVYEKVKQSLGADDVVQYTVLSLEEDAKGAIEYVEKNTDKAKLIAMGVVYNDTNITNNNIATAVAEKAIEDGNMHLAAMVTSKRSLDLTRAGQEIVTERGRVGENATSTFVKQVIARRMRNAANMKDSIIDTVTAGKKSKAKSVTDKIKKQADTVKNVNRKKMKQIANAQKILDSIRCK